MSSPRLSVVPPPLANDDGEGNASNTPLLVEAARDDSVDSWQLENLPPPPNFEALLSVTTSPSPAISRESVTQIDRQPLPPAPHIEPISHVDSQFGFAPSIRQREPDVTEPTSPPVAAHQHLRDTHRGQSMFSKFARSPVESSSHMSRDEDTSFLRGFFSRASSVEVGLSKLLHETMGSAPSDASVPAEGRHDMMIDSTSTSNQNRYLSQSAELKLKQPLNQMETPVKAASKFRSVDPVDAAGEGLSRDRVVAASIGRAAAELSRTPLPRDAQLLCTEKSTVAQETAVIVHTGLEESIVISPGDEKAFEVKLSERGTFYMSISSTIIPVTPPYNTNWIVVSRLVDGVSISLSFCSRTFGLPENLFIVGRELVVLPGSGLVSVQDIHGKDLVITRGSERAFTPKLDTQGFFSWRCGKDEKRSKATSNDVCWILAEHTQERKLIWRYANASGKIGHANGSETHVESTPPRVYDAKVSDMKTRMTRGDEQSEETTQEDSSLERKCDAKADPGTRMVQDDGPSEDTSVQREGRFHKFAPASGLSVFCTCADFPFCTMHCPCFFATVFFFIVLVLTGALAVVPEVETNFDSFLQADSHANEVRTVYLDALTKRGSDSRRLVAREHDRRLTNVGLRRQYPTLDMEMLHKSFRFTIVYSSRDGADLMVVKTLNDIRAFEVKMKNLPQWRSVCLTVSPELRNRCNPGISLLSYLWPTRDGDADAKYHEKENVSYNLTGTGREWMPLKAVLEVATQRNMIVGFFPSNYDGRGSQELRSIFEFSMRVCTLSDTMAYQKKRIKEVNAMYDKFIKEELLPLLREQAEDEDAKFNINWYGDAITSFEMWETLMNDALFAIGSVIFIWLYLTFHTRSPFLSSFAIFITMLSIPVALMTALRLSGGTKITGACFLSLFLIVGLGADVVLVFVSFFEESREIYDDDDYAKRVNYLYHTAAKACLATTLTTCASFFANLASVLKSLREFGFFMGLCIVDVYFFILVAMPPILIANEKICKNVAGSFPRHLPMASQDTEVLRTRHGNVAAYNDVCLWPLRRICVLWFALMPLIMLIWTAAVIEVDGGMPEMFPEDHNQNRGKRMKDKFTSITQIFVDEHLTRCNLDRETPGSESGACSLNWCHICAHPPSRNSSECSCKSTEAANIFRKNHESGVRVEATIGAQVRFVGAPDLPQGFWDSAAWAVFVKRIAEEANGVTLNIKSNESAREGRNLSTMVQEDWESGTPLLSRYFLAPDVRLHIGTDSQDSPLHPGHYRFANFICFCGAPSCKFRDEQQCQTSSETWVSLQIPSNGRLLQDRARERSPMLFPQTDESYRGRSSESGTVVLPSTAVLRPSRGLLSILGVDVSIVWGLKVEAGTPLLGDLPEKLWSFDSDFQLDGPKAQRHVFNACRELRDNPSLIVRDEVCWISDFRSWLLRRNELFPTLASRFESLLDEYINTNPLLPTGSSVKDYMWFDDLGVLRGTFIQFDLLISPNAASSTALELMLKWNEAVHSLNTRAPLDAQNAWHTSSLWIRAEAERAIIDSTVATLLVSLGCGFIGTFCFTHFDCLLSGFVVTAVICVTISLAFFMSVIMGWKTGAVEVLGLIVFVGYSITYSLHIAHKYGERVKQLDGTIKKASKNSIASIRRKAVWYAVMQMSNSVVGSAVTTLGSSLFLFFCSMTIFVKLAAVLFVVTFFAAMYSLVALPAALLTCGPSGVCGCGHVVARLRGDTLGYEAESCHGARHGRLDSENSESSQIQMDMTHGRSINSEDTEIHVARKTSRKIPAIKSLAVSKSPTPSDNASTPASTTKEQYSSYRKSPSKGRVGDPISRAE